MIDKHFPKGSELAKYFNRNNIKVSYSCMPSIGSILASHNKKIMGRNRLTEEGCNCHKGTQSCLVNGKCQTKSVIYEAEISHPGYKNDKSIYIGLTEGTFKKRYSNHISSFNDMNKEHVSKLSSLIWELKNKGINYNIKWKFRCQAPPYSNISKLCQLCITKKTLIMFADKRFCINKRDELMGKCRHKDKWLLKNT